MFTVRRLLSVGLRTTLPQLRENVRNIKRLSTPRLSIDNSVVNDSRKAPWTVGPKSPRDLKIDRELREEYEVLELEFTCPKCNGINDGIVVPKVAYEQGAIARECRGCGDYVTVVDHVGLTTGNSIIQFEEMELCKSVRLHPKKLENSTIEQAQPITKD